MIPASAIMPIMLVAVYCACKQRVAWHHANDGQRNRCHDDQRDEVRAKLRDYQ
jgi:hypothetical protein